MEFLRSLWVILEVLTQPDIEIGEEVAGYAAEAVCACFERQQKCGCTSIVELKTRPARHLDLGQDSRLRRRCLFDEGDSLSFGAPGELSGGKYTVVRSGTLLLPEANVPRA